MRILAVCSNAVVFDYLCKLFLCSRARSGTVEHCTLSFIRVVFDSQYTRQKIQTIVTATNISRNFRYTSWIHASFKLKIKSFNRHHRNFTIPLHFSLNRRVIIYLQQQIGLSYSKECFVLYVLLKLHGPRACFNPQPLSSISRKKKNGFVRNPFMEGIHPIMERLSIHTAW